jgi:DNA-binding NarL/FixJ family response regulator
VALAHELADVELALVRQTGKVLGGLVERSTQAGSPLSDALSDREEEVLRLIARGFTNREIAVRLDISVKTVETHKARDGKAQPAQSC